MPTMKHKINMAPLKEHPAYLATIPIDMFLTAATSWLQGNLDKPSPEIPSHKEPRSMKRTVGVDANTGLTSIVAKTTGPTMIHGGRREGYNNTMIERMVKIANMGKQMGATHIGAI